MTTTSNCENSLLSTAESSPINPGLKLLQRLFYYLETNQTWHHHNINNNNNNNKSNHTNEQQPMCQTQTTTSTTSNNTNTVTNNGMSLPINAIIWFLQQYVQCSSQSSPSPPNDDSVDDDVAFTQQRTSTDHIYQKNDPHNNINNHEQRNLIQRIQPLLPYCTKLRITSQSWPSPNDTDRKSVV